MIKVVLIQGNQQITVWESLLFVHVMVITLKRDNRTSTIVVMYSL